MRVLFCHGLGSSVRNRVAQQLASLLDGTKHTFEASAANLIDCSVQYPAGSPCWRVTSWLAALEERLEVDQVEGTVIVAQSAGSHPALNATIKHPKKVKGLFLISPGFDVDFGYVEKVIPGAMARLAAGERVVHPASRNGAEALVDLEAFRLFRETCVSTREGMLPVPCPVRIVHGTHDALVPHANSVRLLAKLDTKEKSLRAVPEGSHFLSLEDAVVRDEFQAFCAMLGLADDLDRKALRAKA